MIYVVPLTYVVMMMLMFYGCWRFEPSSVVKLYSDRYLCCAFEMLLVLVKYFQRHLL